MNTSMDLMGLEPSENIEAVDMANRIWNIMADSESKNPAIPASALGYALAVLMSRTSYPEETFSTALTARDSQYSELVTVGEAEKIYEH